MIAFDVDEVGQIVGVGHHDGMLRSVILRGDEIDIGVTGSAGRNAQVTLAGVTYFALNNLREGNIIDRMYLWQLDKAPEAIRRRLREVLEVVSIDVLRGGSGESQKIFHLECSYGAELFALVNCVRTGTSD